MPELEDLFERFRRRGDVAALGIVFDRAAPELLKLARHLAPDAAAAEDLVQATFLAAIEHADRFDASRELAPWLVGILTNKAKLARALRSREFDPSRLGEHGEQDPALDAELRELAAALERALARMPAKYRDVLRRSLLRGEKPEEIARALRREPGAVRVQLHRGLARLRRLLPAGLALGLGVPIAPRGLGAMRASLLKHASMAASGAGVLSSSFVVGGIVVSTKSLAAVVGAIAAVAGGLWWFARGESAYPEPAPMEVAARETAPAPAVAETTPPEVIDAERNAVTSPTAPLDNAEPYGALAFEVVWHDSTPAAGVELDCTPLGESQPYNHVAAVVTDSDGRAELPRIHEGEVRIRVDRVGPYGNYTAAVQRGATVTRRIEIPRGVDVRGRVLDPDRNPVAGARMWLGYSVGFPTAPAFEAARADQRAEFVIRSAHSSGNVFATASGFAPSVSMPLGDAEHAPDGSLRIELVLRTESAEVEGVVSDAAGTPIPEAPVAVRCRGSFLRARTDAKGRYRFDGLPAQGAAVFVAANGFAQSSQQVVLEPGRTSRADFTLGRGGSLAGTVTDDHGAIISGAWLQTEPMPENLYWSSLRVESTTSDASGRYQLDAIAPGAFTVAAGRHGDTRRILGTFEVREGAALVWDVVFDDGLTIAGRAEHPNGAPLAGWKVNAFPRQARSVVVPSTTCGADGEFQFTNLLDDQYDVLLYPPDDAEHWVDRSNALRPPMEGVKLVADPSVLLTAFVSGRVVDTRGEPLGKALLTLRDERERCWTAHSGESDGRFRIGPTNPGDLRLSVTPSGHRTFAIVCNAVAPREVRDLGDVVVPDTGSVEIDIRRLDGATLDRPRVRLVDASGHSAILECEDGITFRNSAPLHVGRYRLFPVASNAATLIMEIEVRASEPTRTEVRLAEGVQAFLTVRPAADERSYGPIQLTVRDSGGNVVIEDSTELMDARAGVTGLNAGFAYGRYTLEVTASDGRRATLEFEVKRDDDPFKALTLDFPAG